MAIERKGTAMIRGHYEKIEGTPFWAWVVEVCTQDGYTPLKRGLAVTALGANTDMMNWIEARFPA